MAAEKRIAIIGSGISGLSAAYFLKDKYDITLYEKDNRLGGHSRTISINNKKINVDTGFIVLNDRTYPNLNNLFKELDIELTKTEMSFSISAQGGELEWSGTSLDSLFAQRKNIFNLKMLKGIFDILKFNRQALFFTQKFPAITLQELIDKMNLGSWFSNYYILPMGGAIWSCSYKQIMDFPASSFVQFFHNHGLLNITNRPQWYTLKNKSTSYVQKLEQLIREKGKILTDCSISSIIRKENTVEIKAANNDIQYFDEVIFSCHPEEILQILKDPTPEELSALTKFSRQKNIVYTHSDLNQMPKLHKCWSSWNYLYNKDSKNVAVTYWMNKLQHIDDSFPLFVTLNPNSIIPDNKIHDIYGFYHPVFDQNSIQAQKLLDKIQGNNKIWFCGAYLRYGFHEDGIWSTTAMINKMNKQ